MKKTLIVPLGRWNNDNPAIKSLLANIDSCGHYKCKKINITQSAIQSGLIEHRLIKKIEKK